MNKEFIKAMPHQIKQGMGQEYSNGKQAKSNIMVNGLTTRDMARASRKCLR